MTKASFSLFADHLKKETQALHGTHKIILVAALLFYGNQSRSLHYMRDHHFMSSVPQKSGFTKRLHGLSDLLLMLFQTVGHVIKGLNCNQRYILDSYPVAVCQNIRISRSKLLRGEQYRGWIASKRQYFYGIRLQVIATEEGLPVEVCFVPGCTNDADALNQLQWDFEAGTEVYADSGYTCYLFEDLTKEAGINILTVRKKNSKRKDAPWINFLKHYYRKRVETSFSEVTNYLPKALHSVTAEGFFIKVLLMLMAFQFDNVI